MVKRDANNGPVDIAGLTRGLDSLIRRCRQLEAESAGLRTDLARLEAEREAAEKAKNMARERVAAVLSRLKTLEK